MIKVVFASEFVSNRALVASFARRTRSLGRELARQGCNVTLVTHEQSDSTEGSEGVTLVHFPKKGGETALLTATGRATNSFVFGWALARLVHRIGPDVMVASFHDPIQGLLAMLTGRLYGAVTIFDAQDTWLVLEHEHRGPIRNMLRKLLEASAFHLADSVTTVTPTLKAMIQTRYRLAGSRVHVAYNGADPAAEPMRVEKDIDVIHVGSPRSYYNTLESLDGLAHLCRQGVAKRVVFLGSTTEDYVARVQRRANQLGLEPFLHLVSEVPPDRVGHWLARTKVALHTLSPNPIYKCAIGMKVFEYLAHGIPVVHMGPVDGETARLIQEGQCGLVTQSPAQLGEALVTLLNDVRLRSEFAAAALSVAQRYSWRESAKAISRLFNHSGG